MRRALRYLAVLTALLACFSGGLGLAAVRAQRLAMEAAESSVIPPRGGLELAHAITGHAAGLTACAASAIAFLLGLHGLLETGGRRLRAAILFALGPLLMGLALAADLTGLRGWREVPAGLAFAEQGAFLRAHAAVPGTGFAAAAVVLAVAAWALAPPDKPSADEEDDDEADA